MTKKVLVPAADGSEDIELTCITNILRRANFNVVVASLMESNNIVLSRGIKIIADSHINNESAETYDGVFLPGGVAGAEYFGKSAPLKKFMQDIRTQGKWFGAICAAPVLSLSPLGMLDGVKTITCYPALKDKVPAAVQWSEDAVVRCGKCLTSKGPGTSIAFALAIVSALATKELAQQLSKDLLVDQDPNVVQALSKF